jgi:hypothetical protein
LIITPDCGSAGWAACGGGGAGAGCPCAIKEDGRIQIRTAANPAAQRFPHLQFFGVLICSSNVFRSA